MSIESDLIATPGVKAMFLIKRRPASTREELIAHWFANHMPGVMSAMDGIVSRYVATVYDPDGAGNYPWDGVAQLSMDQPLSVPAEPFGSKPTDSFQEHAEPYRQWATQEYVVIDGSEHLRAKPLTLNAPYPTTRSGFFKVSFLVKAKPNTDFAAFFDHWLNVHAQNVANTMGKVHGIRYVVNLSLNPAEEPFAGMAELYFRDPAGWKRYKEVIEDDGMEQWAANEGTLVLRSQTEFVGIQ
jgi:hypothetical protein